MLIFILALDVIASQSVSDDVSEGSWSARMREMQDLLVDTLPYLESDLAFADPHLSKTIANNLRGLASTSQSLTHPRSLANSISPPDDDPTLTIGVDSLADNTRRAYTAFLSGNTLYARDLVRSSVRGCVACHVRGPQYLEDRTQRMQLQGRISNSEHAAFLIATRNFSQAKDLLESELHNRFHLKMQQRDWYHTAQQAMRLAVLFDNDKNAAMHVVDRVFAMPVPNYIFSRAQDWRMSIDEWRVDGEVDNTLAAAQQLIERGRRKANSNPPRSADIEYLRAARIVHECLRSAPEAAVTAKALYMLAQIYNDLPEFDSWAMSVHFLESCIRAAPHTSVAQSCYRQYAQNFASGPTDAWSEDTMAAMGNLAAPEQGEQVE